ncbi:MAG: zf-HC2 domain-containing protein, partial [Chloroflexi bacterium]
MRAHLSNHDYEQLSAYIDGQLAPAERRKLEERLRVHADLQAALDELTRTRTLLRSAPRRRAPRNFSLTPAMVGERAAERKRPWWNLFPVLSFTSALATLALVATILFQLLPGQMSSQTVAMQPQADRVAEIVEQTMTAMQAAEPADQNQAAPEAQKAAPETERPAQPAAGAAQPTEEQSLAARAAPTATLQAPAAADTFQTENIPPIITWNGNTTSPSAGGFGGGGGDGQGPSLGPLLGPPSASAPDTAFGKGGADITAGSSGTIVIPAQENTPEAAAELAPEQPAAEPTPGTAATPAPAEAAPAAANPEISGTGPILGVPPSSEGGQIVERKAILGQSGNEPESAAQAQSEIQPGDQSLRGQAGSQILFGIPMLVVQVLLVLIAVAAGVAAFLIRNRAKA